MSKFVSVLVCVLQIETILQEGNEALVHHIVLYGCWGIEDAHLRDNNKTEGVCFTSEMPEFEDSCRSTLHAWAVGGGVSKTFQKY